MRTSLLLALTHSICLTSRLPSSRNVVLRFDQPVRHLLTPYSKVAQVAIAPNSPTPLQDLRSLLRARLQTKYSQIVNIEALEIRHGRRKIETDTDLQDIVSKTTALGVAPTLRILPRDNAELPHPPTSESGMLPFPTDVGPLRLVSFFKFVALDSKLREEVQTKLRPLLLSFHVRGTVYIAAEGVNGQFAVPNKHLDELQRGINAIDGLGDLKLNVQHASLGIVETGETGQLPYRKLIVREKEHILTDGLQKAQMGPEELDWDRSGTELDAADWHAMLLQRSAPGRGDAGVAPGDHAPAATPLLLDCRNDYETEVGSFEGAEPLNTEVFSESWEVLRDRLRDVPRDQPIMTFCTGGIRCVKTNAFLEQTLGFTKTYRLRDGIHGYLRHIADQPDKESKWQGENFVFYEKAGEEESDDGEGEMESR